ncbi:hypothetical protein ABW19_dt0200451 [Dactylella cylindrospora]|nr:hypothetical protein ABW19_dt0200451 [Dactylella cylindrospora]
MPSQASTVGRKIFSWYLFPIFGSVVWVGTLFGLLISWLVDGRPHYESMDPLQTMAYISDIGADYLKPLFITGSSVTAVCFFLSLLGARWLRHKGRLLPNTSWTQRIFSVIAIIGGFVGGAGLVLLAIFDTKRFLTLHRLFLAVFCIGVLVSALATVLVEYWRLEHNHRWNKALRISFWAKLIFFVVEFGLAVAFGILMSQRRHNAGAILEWVTAFVFTGYLMSFLFDLLPAARSNTGQFKDMKGSPPRP